jgi:DNA-binding NtrC family response regulator
MTADILIVDDEEQVRTLMAKFLINKGYSVRTASEGEAAIREVGESQPDLVILDILMPGKEGIETLREISEQYPGLKVMAISGGGTIGAEGYLALAEKFGARETLEKPFSSDSLCEAVEKLLRES